MEYTRDLITYGCIWFSVHLSQTGDMGLDIGAQAESVGYRADGESPAAFILSRPLGWQLIAPGHPDGIKTINYTGFQPKQNQ